MRSLQRGRRSGEDGQAIVEYILMLVLVLSIVAIIGVGFKKSILNVWQGFSRQISAACPTGCPPKHNVKFQ